MLASICDEHPFEALTPQSHDHRYSLATPVMATPLAVAAATAVFTAASAGAVIGTLVG